MSSPRIAASLILITSKTTTTAITRILPSAIRAQTLQQQNTRALQVIRSSIQRRWNSGAQQKNDGISSNRVYEYRDIVNFISKPSKDRILIDVREPHELQQTGRIPGALNIPTSSQADAYFITDEEFEDRFGFERPSKEVEVVFYCKAGVRSRAAAALAREGGWRRVGDYEGSWLDWEARGGAVETVGK